MDGNWRGIGGDGKFGRVRYEGTRRGKEKREKREEKNGE